MSTYVIGDIQGCHQSLLACLAKINAIDHDAHFIFVGDLVNRGPDSLATLRTIKQLGAKAQTVLGNHDLHLLMVAHNIQATHATDTFDDILNAPDCQELLHWIRHQPLAIWHQEHLIVHAGVLPQWSAQQTMRLAHEVQNALQGAHWLEFLQTLYGNTPDQWSDQLTGAPRLRCIVNALTRIRFCTPLGKMNFSAKKGIDNTPLGYIPWFDVPNRKTKDNTIVFGHWSALGLMLTPNIIAIDTGCVWGGKLTAVCLENRHVIAVDCPTCRAHD